MHLLCFLPFHPTTSCSPCPPVLLVLLCQFTAFVSPPPTGFNNKGHWRTQHEAEAASSPRQAASSPQSWESAGALHPLAVFASGAGLNCWANGSSATWHRAGIHAHLLFSFTLWAHPHDFCKCLHYLIPTGETRPSPAESTWSFPCQPPHNAFSLAERWCKH